MNTATLFQALQAKIASEHLSDKVHYVDRYGNLVDKPLLDASLDEIAFAIQTMHQHSSRIYQRRSALEQLYELARRHGCLGSERIAGIAEEVLK